MHRFAPILPLTLLLLVAPADASAQSRVGGGLSLSELFGDDVGENDTRSGLALGASAGLFSIGPARILAEVHYRQKGADDVMEETLRDYEQGLTFGGGFDVVVLRGQGAIGLEGATSAGCRGSARRAR